MQRSGTNHQDNQLYLKKTAAHVRVSSIPWQLDGLDSVEDRLEAGNDLMLPTLLYHVIAVVPDIRRRTADDPRLVQLHAQRRSS